MLDISLEISLSADQKSIIAVGHFGTSGIGLAGVEQNGIKFGSLLRVCDQCLDVERDIKARKLQYAPYISLSVHSHVYHC